MPFVELAFAVFALLLTPGPTNAVLAIAGSERGFAGAARLIPLAILGYLITTMPLALAGAEVQADLPLARPVVTGLAAIWVGWLALRMWLAREGGTAVTVTAGRLFLTTLLNPKALIIGLVFLPADEAMAPRFAVLAAAIAVVSVAWVAIGVTAAGRGGHMPLLRRGAAVWLGILAATLAARAMAG